MSKLFTPSSTDLLNMVKAAEAKFEASRKEARAQINRDKAIAQRQRWGAIDSRGRVVY